MIQILLKDIKKIIARNVSPTVAVEFMAYLKVARQYPLDKIKLAYTDPLKAPIPTVGKSSGRIDTSLALLAAVAFAKKGEEISDDEFWNLTEYLMRMDRVELVMPFLKMFNKMTSDKFKDAKYLQDDRYAKMMSSFG